MQGFKECFEAYGANYTVTMERFLGNEALYLKTRNMLFPDDNLQKLGDALHAGDHDGALQAAHTLKGVVSNLGLSSLCDAICAIVEPLRAGEEREDDPSLYRTVQAEYQRASAFRDTLKGANENG